MNVTFDDTSPYLKFSSEWRVQDATDPNFWQGTYHGVETKGANMSVTFTGAGIYVFGSRGPQNAKYSVQIDDKIYYFDGASSSEGYQQMLYGASLRQDSHTLVLTHNGADSGLAGWLDIDYIMITEALGNGVNSQTNPGSTDGLSSILSATGTTSGSGSGNSGAAAADSAKPASTTKDNTTLIAAIVLGVVLGLVLLGVAGFFAYRRRSKGQKDEEDFRRGTGSSANYTAPAPTMHTRSMGMGSTHGTGPLSPASGAHTAGPFDTPAGSQIAHTIARSGTSSPGPSVLQIGRSVAILDTDSTPVPLPPRAHSSLSHSTGFSTSSYGPSPMVGPGAVGLNGLTSAGGETVQQTRSVLFDALRDASSGVNTHKRSSVGSLSGMQLNFPTGAGAPAQPAWLNYPPTVPETESKGKEWKAQGAPPVAGSRTGRTWNAGGGAPSIKTFVQVMDE